MPEQHKLRRGKGLHGGFSGIAVEKPQGALLGVGISKNSGEGGSNLPFTADEEHKLPIHLSGKLFQRLFFVGIRGYDLQHLPLHTQRKERVVPEKRLPHHSLHLPEHHGIR
jgi:hypothetical protein